MHLFLFSNYLMLLNCSQQHIFTLENQGESSLMVVTHPAKAPHEEKSKLKICCLERSKNLLL